jgi:hypothetical protein
MKTLAILFALAATAAAQIYQPPASTDITDSTTVGRAVLTASNAAAARAAIEVELTNLSSTPTLTSFTNTGNAVIGTNTTNTLTIGGTVTAAGATGTSSNAMANFGTVNSVLFIATHGARATIDTNLWTSTTNGAWTVVGSGFLNTNGVFPSGVVLQNNPTNSSTNAIYFVANGAQFPIGEHSMSLNRGIHNAGFGMLFGGEFGIRNTNGTNANLYLRIVIGGVAAAADYGTALGTNGIVTNGIVIESRGSTNSAETTWRLTVWSTNGVVESGWSNSTSARANNGRIMVVVGSNATRLYDSYYGGTFNKSAPLIVVTNAPSSSGVVSYATSNALAFGMVETGTNSRQNVVRISEIVQLYNMNSLGY